MRRDSDGIRMMTKGIFIVTAIVMLAVIVGGILIVGFIIQNPEGIGDWFRRLFGA